MWQHLMVITFNEIVEERTVMKKIVECVPNFSEGQDLDKIEKIVAFFRGTEGVKLLDYQRDEDHNRLVVTAVGEPEALKTAVIEAIGAAITHIDMREHKGQHPRMGAVDVVPFIPIRNLTMDEAIETSMEVATTAAPAPYACWGGRSSGVPKRNRAGSGAIWLHEHGPRGGDEVNRILPGVNYGWPAITHGVDYSGAVISPYTEREGMAQPGWQWTPSIAPSGLALYEGDRFPTWSGDLFVGALVGRDVPLAVRNAQSAKIGAPRWTPRLSSSACSWSARS